MVKVFALWVVVRLVVKKWRMLCVVCRDIFNGKIVYKRWYLCHALFPLLLKQETSFLSLFFSFHLLIVEKEFACLRNDSNCNFEFWKKLVPENKYIFLCGISKIGNFCACTILARWWTCYFHFSFYREQVHRKMKLLLLGKFENYLSFSSFIRR